MKKLLIIIILTLYTNNLDAQLTDKLYELSQSLSELMIALSSSVKPIKPTPVKLTAWQ